MGRAIALYTALRLLAFATVFVLLSAVGVGGLVGVLLALLLSSLAGLFLLRRQRDAVTAALDERRTRRQQEKARLRGLLDAPPAASEDRAQREP